MIDGREKNRCLEFFNFRVRKLMKGAVRLAYKHLVIQNLLFLFSIIIQMIIEILVISLVEDYVISYYNHLTRGDYSGSIHFQTAAWRFVDVSEEEISTMKENAIPKGIKDAAKSRVTLFDDRIWKFLLIVIKKNRVNCSGDVVDVNTNINENNNLNSPKMFFI